VTCYAGEIGQAVLNIVVNAAHAIADVVNDTDKQGLISVRTRQEGQSVVVTISDTGTGIPEQVRARIFDPFFTTKEVGRGSGQGLAIAWSTVTKAHGGELTFDTTPNEGTTFYLRIPIDGRASET
jgi:two-component system, NtrC family, sensor kinase